MKTAQLLAASQQRYVTLQFERALNFIIRNKLGFKYDWTLHIWGDIFSFESEKKYILGLCNSKVASHFLEFLSPTMNYELGDIEEIPVCVTLHVVITMVHLVIVSITIIRVTVPSMKQLPIQERL